MKKRIALVVNTLSGGGAEKTVSNLSLALADVYDTDIIVNDTFHLDYPYRGNIISLNLPAFIRQENMGYQMLALVMRSALLLRMKKKRNYAAVISVSGMTNLSNVLSGKGKQRKTKTILSVHNDVGSTRNRGWRKRFVVTRLFPICFKCADRTVACSKEIADELVDECSLAREKSVVIYNGLDLEKIKENASKLPAKPLCDKGEKLIVSVGRLAQQKGQWHLIRAVKLLRDQGIPIKLVILGEGELRNKLEELVKEASLEDSVFLPGFVENPHQYMKRADAVVFPSLYEGFSNAIEEALACEVPVISTDHKTGAREILAPETDYRVKVHDHIEEAQYGVLIPVCDGVFRGTDGPLTKEEQMMADAIRRMVTDSKWSEHYRVAAPKRAEQLAIQTIAGEWIRVIEE